MIRELLKKYPGTQSVYDTGKYYAVTCGDTTMLLNKRSLEIERMVPTYSSELAKICENAIPVWPDDLDDD